MINMFLELMFILTYGIGDLYTTKRGTDVSIDFESNILVRECIRRFGFLGFIAPKTIAIVLFMIYFRTPGVLYVGIITGSLIMLWNTFCYEHNIEVLYGK